MKKSINFLAAYLVYWLSYFLFFRITFLLYHKGLTAELGSATIGGVLWNGLLADFLFSASLCLFPALLFLLWHFLPHSLSGRAGRATSSAGFISFALQLYTGFCLVFFTILCSADLELFRIWGYRIDDSPLLYLSTPTEMLFSLGGSPVWLLFILNLLINLFFGLLYSRLLHPYSLRIQHSFRQSLPASVFSVAIFLLILPLWKETTLISLKPDSSYFSDKLFANQATINVPWNFFYALGNDGEHTNPYQYFQPSLADSLLNTLYGKRKDESKKVLNTAQAQPNVMLIILESFTAKVSRHTGRHQGVMPHFDRLAEEGLLFTQLYASGDRSDKGLVALLSGYPAQPSSPLLATPEKAASLPHLNQAFEKAGYHTAFYYGGKLAFANLQDYLQKANYHQLIAGNYFQDAQPKARWGAHDEVVLKKIWDDIQAWDNKRAERQADKQAFFKVLFTLSSHEPFDIPGKSYFGKKGSTARYLSALHYTDSLVGHFIDKAKKEPWYQNTLFIIVGDHGHTYPGNSRVYEQEKFHIPMLWIGGALKHSPEHISKTMSQTDLAASLLQQLGLSAEAFPWSKNILNSRQAGFAHYFFYDGVGLVTDSSYLSFDHKGKMLIEQEGSSGLKELDYAKAYLQKSYGDYLNK